MKKQAYTMIGALVFVTLLTISTARAQSTNQSFADIPFEFSAANQSLPAGKYSLSIVNPESDLKVMRIRSLDGKQSLILLMHSVNGKTKEAAKLVFHRYGDRYFLAQAWTPADNIGMEAPKSRAERDVQKQLASSTRKTETVALSTLR